MACAEFVIKNHCVHLTVLLKKIADLLQFSAAKVGAVVRMVQILGESSDDAATGCLDQKIEFVQIFAGACRILYAGCHSNYDGRLL